MQADGGRSQRNAWGQDPWAFFPFALLSDIPTSPQHGMGAVAPGAEPGPRPALISTVEGTGIQAWFLLRGPFVTGGCFLAPDGQVYPLPPWRAAVCVDPVSIRSGYTCQ